MGFFDLFRKKRKLRHSRRPSSSSKQNPKKMQVDIEGVKNQMAIINIALKKHDDQLAEHTRIIGEHSKSLEKLEQKISAVEIVPPAREKVPIVRPVEAINPSTSRGRAPIGFDQRFDINRFSEQEKRILAVFFQNKQMSLSYVDIARALNKSPYTIKNQMNRMRLKADLFDRTIGDQSRNRFNLKDGLRIEKYLNVV
jgi:hypothetical protein